MDIKANVVSIVPYMTGDVQPILQYEIDGIVKKYIYIIVVVRQINILLVMK